MALIDKHISIDKLLSYFVIYAILDRAEAEHCRKTGQLPKDILLRLKIAEQIGKN
jgi:hypothetical protein